MSRPVLPRQLVKLHADLPRKSMRRLTFGNGKEHYGLDRVKYTGLEGSEMWVRAGLLAMNLKTALQRA
jgi:hypothetical protein